ncbi:NAD(P)H-binding protein [Saccharopolyspora sp. NPDC050389]|uniref:NAD(P)H-binding protein n=1 Tax=Saccharopolyspora sp. NPDC050389 TaxID=3155516 RepID=UPI0033E5D525
MTFLVTGATGSVGRHVVEHLRDAGERVRIMTRNPDSAGFSPDVEVARGDLGEPGTLAPALDGIERAYLFPHEGAADFAELAKSAGVRRIVVLSSASAAAENKRAHNADSHTWHRSVERAVEDSGIDCTAIRPGAFAANSLIWAGAIQAGTAVRSAHGSAAQAPVHEADIAAVAATALLDDGHVGAKYELSGPAAISIADQVRTIGEVLGRDIPFEAVTSEQERAELAEFIPEEVVDMLLGYWAEAVDRPDQVLPTVEQVTGRPARSFAQWAAEHAADFR